MRRFFRTVILSTVLLWILPINAWAADCLIPVGKIIGLQLLDDTVTIAAFEENNSPAKAAGLKVGDQIIQIDQQTIHCTEDVRAALRSGNQTVTLTIRRGSKQATAVISPDLTEDGPRLGVYLRQGVSGIGTITFYDPETGRFGTLGHGVHDGKGTLLALKRGSAYQSEITAVVPGKCGEPGQLKGRADAADICGTLLKNTPQGVFGTVDAGWPGDPIPVAPSDTVTLGPATIRSTVTEAGPQDYSVEILKIYPRDNNQCRNLLLKVTDPELLAITGGIVQGMSGSPIIQDGKLVGAVTHVLVNDPTRGYGIFIENMLKAAS